MLVKALVFATFSLTACAGERHAEQAPAAVATPKPDQLGTLYRARLDEAAALRGEGGWLAPMTCDGALMVGKYGASWGVDPIDWGVAEYPGTPGRFARRPLATPCWSPEAGDTGAQTTWSRDMGLGLLAYAWRKGDLALVQRHAAYGEANPLAFEGFPAWRMGEPFADGRVIYTPQMIGGVYQVLHAVGGAYNPRAEWPSAYTPGLDGYQAHLQMMDIWLRAEISEASGDALPRKPETDVSDEAPVAAMRAMESMKLLDVSETMYARIEEHATREPNDPFYVYMQGLFNGNLEPALDLCLDPAMPLGSYAHCNEAGYEQTCKLANWIFACGNVLKRYGGI